MQFYERSYLSFFRYLWGIPFAFAVVLACLVPGDFSFSVLLILAFAFFPVYILAKIKDGR